MHEIKIIHYDITTDGTPQGTELRIDGRLMSGIKRISFDARPETAPILTLEIIPGALTINGMADVKAFAWQDKEKI
jgi:hypothetical protein